MKTLARLLRRMADRLDPGVRSRVVVRVDGAAVHRALLDLKRQRGGDLGLS